MNKSIFGLDERVVGALCYVCGPISGIAALVLERENKFVRFHGLQSTIWFLFLLVSGWVLNFILGLPVLNILLGIIFNPILFLGGIVYWVTKIYLAYKAYSGVLHKIPVVGDVVWAQVNK